MKKMAQLFQHRFGPVLVITALIAGVSFATRLVLLVLSFPNLDKNPLHWLGIFLVGLFYDIVVAGFYGIPVALYCWLIKDSWYRHKWQRIPLFILFGILTLLIVMTALSEITFWNEFGVRFNFIAVDYLIYTNEVLGNIQESYNIPLLLSVVVLVVMALLLLCRKPLLASQVGSMRFGRRSVVFFLFLLVPAAGYFLVNNRFKNISHNNYINELAGNGTYEFGAAFWNNEINYNQFYTTQSDTLNIALLREQLAAPNATFTNDPLSIERQIKADSPTHPWNVVLISVESLSGDYMGYFGNKENITPVLDSLIPHSLFFSNFYASGTRTVRGLEALSLAIPPTPGQSIVRRPNNENLFSLGNVLHQKGYGVRYIYGGNSFFDNMGYFFGHNGYQVLDQGDIPESMVHHTTAWGIDDEAAFNYTLQQCDQSFARKELFFNHVMTISNHRPYTYPEGRIDIPPSAQIAQGAVKYTDYAIGQFLKQASTKPWFKQTIFVIVADHCSRSAGKTDLPVNRYHIPCMVYAPALVQPKLEKRLVSQIDLAPTLLGLMNMSYTSRFMGYDIYQMPVERDRIFISTYQNLGYIHQGKLVVLSPQRKVDVYLPDFISGANQPTTSEPKLIQEAISWYQGASYLFKSGKYSF